MEHPAVRPERLTGLVWSFAPPLLIQSAVELGVFDALAGGERSLDEVGAATGASARGLRALLDALVGLGLAQRAGERFGLGPEAAAFLVSGRPGYLGGMFRHIAHMLPTWLQLSEAVRTGRPAAPVNRHEEGAPFFQSFVEDLFHMGYAAARALAQELRLDERAGAPSVLDLAAGSGVWSIALTESAPRARATAVDWAEVLEVTRRVTARHGLADRYTYLAGDIQEVDLGTGHQVATLGHILHSEGRERSRRLLERVFRALAPGGTIAIAEFVPDDDRSGPLHTLVFAVNMLLHTEAGDTFTFAEMRGWLEEVGFVDVRQFPAPAPSPLILATRP